MDVSQDYVDVFRSVDAVVSTQEPPPIALGSSPYYEGCLLKFVAFRMHQIDSSLHRVLGVGLGST